MKRGFSLRLKVVFIILASVISSNLIIGIISGLKSNFIAVNILILTMMRIY